MWFRRSRCCCCLQCLLDLPTDSTSQIFAPLLRAQEPDPRVFQVFYVIFIYAMAVDTHVLIWAHFFWSAKTRLVSSNVLVQSPRRTTSVKDLSLHKASAMVGLTMKWRLGRPWPPVLEEIYTKNEFCGRDICLLSNQVCCIPYGPPTRNIKRVCISSPTCNLSFWMTNLRIQTTILRSGQRNKGWE